MRKNQLLEADGILQRALTALTATVLSTRGPETSTFRQTIGAMRAASQTEISAGTVAGDLWNCFEQARLAGATTVGMTGVRLGTEAEKPVFLAGELMATAIVRFCLVEEAQILSATVFASREDIDKAMDYFGDAIDRAMLFASDNFDQQGYISLAALAAAVAADLNARARPLPRMVNFAFAEVMPALWIANRLYGDASRVAQIVAENRIVHPAFCPATIKALSA